MGKRTRDEVIYSRVDYRVKQEFELQMKESGNKTSADFIGVSRKTVGYSLCEGV